MIRIMQLTILSLLFLAASAAFATKSETPSKGFTIRNEEISDVAQKLSKQLNMTFVLDSSVKGKITIYSPANASNEVLFELFSTALAQNGFAVVDNANSKSIVPAMVAIRSGIGTVTALPDGGPEKLLTWIYKVKYLSAKTVFNSLGQTILVSRTGEVRPIEDTNTLVFTDWVSNLRRIKAMMDTMDVPAK